MRKHRPLFYFLLAGLHALAWPGCYEPKQGCLHADAANFDVSADKPCKDCCTFPKLLLEVKHQVVPPTQPDTFYNFLYQIAYPSPFDTTHFFSINRSRYFISEVKLIDEQGNESGVTDSIELEIPAGVSRVIENNFAKIDRDIFQTRTLGVTPAKGTYRQVRFKVGLHTEYLQINPASVPSGHPLSIQSDTIIYKEGTGYLPNVLIFKPDTLPDTSPLEIFITEPVDITLPFSEPFLTKRGFNIRLTLKVDYLAWWRKVDLQHDDLETIRQKIVQNLPTAFSVAGVKNE